VPYKFHKHLSIYMKEESYSKIQELAALEKKSMNKMLNELIKIGLSKRQEEILGLDQIARAIKADIQLQRDELKKQSNRISSLLSKIGLYAIANRYQTTYLHSRVTDRATAKKTADQGWKYAVDKLKEKVDIKDDSEK
jgi:diphthamide synthase (EF-2-diphthine--ammonia ligase)